MHITQEIRDYAAQQEAAKAEEFRARGVGDLRLGGRGRAQAIKRIDPGRLVAIMIS